MTSKPTTMKPVETKDGEETIYNHPAFGQIQVSRISGQIDLYGADYTHEGYVAIRIHTSKAKRRYHRFWYHQKEDIIEVCLSYAQWSAFVSSMNVGSGVNCTITRKGYEMVPGIEPIEDEADLHIKEIDDTLAGGHKALRDLDKAIDDLKIPLKAKGELKWKVEVARRSIGSSYEFIKESFGEFVESKTERMKANIHSYAESMLMGLGLKSAQTQIGTVQDEKPLAIEDESD